MIQSKREPTWWPFPVGKREPASFSAPSARRQILRLFNGLPLFWRLQLGGWFLVEVFTFPNKWWYFGSFANALFLLAFRLPLSLLFSTCLRSLYLRLGLTGERPWRLGGWVLGSSIVLSILEQFIVRALQPTSVADKFASEFYFGLFCARALIYVAWSLLYFFIKGVIAERARMQRVAAAEAAAARAEIQMLRAQVNPHFLFNALNTIQAGLDHEPHTLVPVVQGLADYLRYSLEHRHALFVPLGDEFDATQHYLKVQKARFGDDLHLECSIDAGARSCLVPGVILQPLLENAFKFGFLTSDLPLRLGVVISVTPGQGAVLEVANSGRWIEPSADRDPAAADGTGLENLRRRLDLLYPAGHRLTIDTDGGWVRIRIELPPNSGDEVGV